MTIEEAIEVLEQDLPCELDEDLKEAMSMAIRSIEAWEKVKEEIREMPTISLNANDVYKAEVLQIIDKHLAEIESEINNG